MTSRNEFAGWELEKLVSTYNLEAEELKKALLSGTPWEELKDKKKRISQLASIIHKHNISKGNPAENTIRIIDTPFNTDSP